jgi:hypothetical protein
MSYMLTCTSSLPTCVTQPQQVSGMLCIAFMHQTVTMHIMHRLAPVAQCCYTLSVCQPTHSSCTCSQHTCPACARYIVHQQAVHACYLALPWTARIAVPARLRVHDAPVGVSPRIARRALRGAKHRLCLLPCVCPLTGIIAQLSIVRGPLCQSAAPPVLCTGAPYNNAYHTCSEVLWDAVCAALRSQ